MNVVQKHQLKILGDIIQRFQKIKSNKKEI